MRRWFCGCLVLAACNAPPEGGFIEVALGARFACAQRSNGSLACWGQNSDADSGASFQSTRPFDLPVIDAIEIAAGGGSACARRANGGVVCWGRGESGQLGNGELLDQTTPVVVPGNDAAEVEVGDSFACLRSSSGSLLCWGESDDGRLGDGQAILATPGSRPDRSTPATVVAPYGTPGRFADATDLSLGSAHACALRSDASLLCWGSNDSGQLGDGTTHDSSIPQTVMHDVVEVAAGASHTCARDTAGRLWCWGSNSHGELGLDPTAHSQALMPIEVPEAGPAVAIRTGRAVTCILRDDGLVSCWGARLGTGDDDFQPTDVASLDRATALDVDDDHACAVHAGRVVCWGDNTFGELGIGSDAPSFSATPLPILDP